MNESLTRDTLVELLAEQHAPCLSLYQPTHRSFPQRQQDPVRYKNLVKQLEASLQQQFPEAECKKLLRPFFDLADDVEFWNHPRDGLAVLGGGSEVHIFRLQRAVPELAIVNDRLHLKPLLRIAQSTDRYQVLCLSRDSVQLFEGNRDALDEVPLAREVPRNQDQALGTELTAKGQHGLHQGFGRASERGVMQHGAGGSGKQEEINKDRDRYFRQVDKAILEHHSQPSGLPLILAALPEQQSHFRRISHNDQLLPEGIEIGQGPGSLSLDELRQKSWEVMRPQYLKRLEGLLEQYGESSGHGLASDRLEEIGQASANSRVATLLLEAERQIPGHIEAGKLQPARADEANASDVLEELAVWVLEQGGEVVVVPPERMPTQSGAAAIYRF